MLRRGGCVVNAFPETFRIAVAALSILADRRGLSGQHDNPGARRDCEPALRDRIASRNFQDPYRP
jgi:hypothetical protein